MVEELKKLLNNPKLLSQAAKASFAEIDSDGSGKISPQELMKLLSKNCSSFGVTKPTPKQVKEIMKKVDSDGDGEVDFEEYLEFLKDTLSKHLEKLEGKTENLLRNSQEKDSLNEKKIAKKIQRFEKYLEETGIPAAFEVIFTEILSKDIEPAKVFVYTASRLRQIGKEVSNLGNK
jgi:hypothetical protein